MTPGPDEFSTSETLANEPPRRRIPRSLLFVATTALVVVAGAGVAGAAALSPTPSPSPSPSPSAGDSTPPSAGPSTSPSAPSDEMPGRGWGHHRMGMGGPAIHGEFVVPDGEGNYTTVATQYGEVTAVDQDSITVKSEDGYTKEYVVNSDTRINRSDDGIDAVKVGQKVRIMAKVDGGTATAAAIHDTTAGRDGMGWRGGKGGGRWHHDQPFQPPSSAPAPTPTATSTS